MHNRARGIGQKTLSKEEIKIDPTGIEFEIESQGGVYAVLLTGPKAKVAN